MDFDKVYFDKLVGVDGLTTKLELVASSLMTDY